MSDSTESRPKTHIGWLLLSPSVWAVHFLASYITIAIWCAKSTGTPGALPPRIAIGVYTIVAVALIGWVGHRGYVQHRSGNVELPHDDGTATDQRRFVGFASVLLSALSAVAVGFTALVVVFVESCD